MAIQFDPQVFLAGLAAQNPTPGVPGADFSAGIRGALVARALHQKQLQDQLDAQAKQDMAERLAGIQQGNLDVARGKLAVDQGELALKQNPPTKAPEDEWLKAGINLGSDPQSEMLASMGPSAAKSYLDEQARKRAEAEAGPQPTYADLHPKPGESPDVPDIDSLKGTTASGHTYVDVSQLSPKQKAPIVQQAYAQGLVPVDKAGVQSLGVIDKARNTLNSQLAAIQPFLAKTAGGRIENYPKVKLGQIFQTNPDLGAYAAWRDGAIQALQGLAAGGTGMRIQQAAINNMIAALPLTTDTWGTAQRKIGIIQGMIDNAERPIVTRNWGKTQPSTTVAPPSQSTPQPTRRRVYNAQGQLQ